MIQNNQIIIRKKAMQYEEEISHKGRDNYYTSEDVEAMKELEKVHIRSEEEKEIDKKIADEFQKLEEAPAVKSKAKAKRTRKTKGE